MYRIEDLSAIFSLIAFTIIVIKGAVWAYKRPEKAIKGVCLLAVVAIAFIAIAIN